MRVCEILLTFNQSFLFMSTNRLLLLPAFLLSMIVISCNKELVKTKVTIVKPVYGMKEDVYKTIKSDAPRDVVKPGKMFLLGQYVYLTEVGEGIHIIDQTNPDHPVNVSFIPIPGNQDVAVKGNYLYADCATDLLVLDIVMRESQRFFQQQLGKTFTLNNPVVEAINGQHDTNWYINNNCPPTGDRYRSPPFWSVTVQSSTSGAEPGRPLGT